MKRVYQSDYGTNGDCLRAALASILGYALQSVPHFTPTHGNPCAPDSQMSQMQNWLRDRGYFLLEMSWPIPVCIGCLPPEALALGTVRSKLGENYSHAVVVSFTVDEKRVHAHVVHDPKGFESDPRDYDLIFVGFLVPLNPSPLNPAYVAAGKEPHQDIPKRWPEEMPEKRN